MGQEEMGLLTWALQHPYLYTAIKMKTAISLLAVFGIVKTTGQVYIASKNSKK